MSRSREGVARVHEYVREYSSAPKVDYKHCVI